MNSIADLSCREHYFIGCKSMAKKKGYKRGIAVFFLISIGTFALMFIFGEKNKKTIVKKRIAYISTAKTLPGDLYSGTIDKSFRKYLLNKKDFIFPKESKIKNVLKSVPPEYNGLYSVEKAQEIAQRLNVHGVVFITYLRQSVELVFISNKFEKEQKIVHRIYRPLDSGSKKVDIAVAKFVNILKQKFPSEEYSINILKSLDSINPWFLGLALVFWFLNLLVDSYLVKVLVRSVEEDIPLRQAFYTVLGNEFLTAVTPFQSGGQPLMIYIMHQNNISVGKGILVTFFKTAGQIYFFALTAPIVLLIWPALINIPGLTVFYIYGILFFGYFLTLTFFVFFKPHLAKVYTLRIFNFIKRFRYFRKKKLGRGLKKTLKEINIFSFFIKDILAKKRMTFLWLFLLTALSWIVRFLIAVAVIWGLAGFIINVVQVVSVQTVTNFLAFFAPSPGASGVVEFSMKKVFEQVILNGEFIFIFVVIWRLINYYLNVILGGLVVVKVLKIKKDSLDKEEKEIEQDYRKTPRQDFEDSA